MNALLSPLAARVRAAIQASEPPDGILRELCLAFEGELPASLVGVAVLDPSSQVFAHAVFPSLADDYASALKGILAADKPGSCALAVFDGKTIDCADVAFDGRFSEGWRQLGLKHGLRALMSTPAVDGAGSVLGTLVVTYPPGSPLSGKQRQTAEAVAGLAAKVLRYRQQAERSGELTAAPN